VESEKIYDLSMPTQNPRNGRRRKKSHENPE
jgi:hypothetical protein